MDSERIDAADQWSKRIFSHFLANFFQPNVDNLYKLCYEVSPMKRNTLIYTVMLVATWAAHSTVRAQSRVASVPAGAVGVAAPAKAKRTISPDAIKRAKLTNLRKDVGLTEEEETRVKPIIDRFVDDVQAARHNPSLDSRTKRQQLGALRARYNSELDAVLTADQQQKLASLKAQRLARLRAGRTGAASSVSESPEPAPSPAAVQ